MSTMIIENKKENLQAGNIIINSTYRVVKHPHDEKLLFVFRPLAGRWKIAPSDGTEIAEFHWGIFKHELPCLWEEIKKAEEAFNAGKFLRNFNDTKIWRMRKLKELLKDPK